MVIRSIIIYFGCFFFRRQYRRRESCYLYLKLSLEISQCLTPLLFPLSGFLLEQEYQHRINQSQCFDALEKEDKVIITSITWQLLPYYISLDQYTYGTVGYLISGPKYINYFCKTRINFRVFIRLSAWTVISMSYTRLDIWCSEWNLSNTSRINHLYKKN